jgi:hypothetical protein
LKYPLAALEELRERERDDAARQLAEALATVAECSTRAEAAVRAHQATLDALAAQPVLGGSGVGTGASMRALGGADLQLRVAYRQRLVAERDARATELAAARQCVAEAQAAAESAREALAAARAQHRAVTLHHEAHRATQRAAAQAREDEALEEAVRSRA